MPRKQLNGRPGKYGDRKFADAGAGMVVCIHCSGTGLDPIDPGSCYLCDGKKKITLELAERTCKAAETISPHAGITTG